jgi:hypothetical protein
LRLDTETDETGRIGPGHIIDGHEVYLVARDRRAWQHFAYSASACQIAKENGSKIRFTPAA